MQWGMLVVLIPQWGMLMVVMQWGMLVVVVQWGMLVVVVQETVSGGRARDS
jgi:hypothetical protein